MYFFPAISCILHALFLIVLPWKSLSNEGLSTFLEVLFPGKKSTAKQQNFPWTKFKRKNSFSVKKSQWFIALSGWSASIKTKMHWIFSCSEEANKKYLHSMEFGWLLLAAIRFHEFNCCFCIDQRVHEVQNVTSWRSICTCQSREQWAYTQWQRLFWLSRQSCVSYRLSIHRVQQQFPRLTICCSIPCVYSYYFTPDCIWNAFNILLVLSLWLINRLYPIRWSIESSLNL